MKKNAVTLILSGAMVLQVSIPALAFANEKTNESIPREVSHQVNDIINIPDPILKAALNKTLDPNRSETSDITKGELESLKTFNIQVLPDIYERFKLENLEGLQYATNLETLVLDAGNAGGVLSNIKQLSGLTKLKNLYLGGLNITDISPLKNLKNLELVQLHYNYNLNDISPLKDLKRLKDIRMDKTEAINIDEQMKIRSEILSNGVEVNVPDVNLKKALNEAIDSSRDNTSYLTKGELSSLTGALNFNVKGIKDLTGVEYLTNLSELRLYKNSIKDLSPLKNLKNLKYLTVAYNYITDVTPIKDLTNLTWLSVGQNSIKDISALSGLVNLETIYLYDNNISDISPLINFKKVTLLDIKDNPAEKDPEQVEIKNQILNASKE